MVGAQGDFWSTLFTARGRSNRGRFWTVVALCAAAYIVAGGLVAALGENPFTVVIAAATIIVAITVGWFNIAKRLHDMGRSGWWILLLIGLYMPVGALAEPWSPDGLQALGILLELILTIATMGLFGGIPGQKATNRFGDPPGQPPVANGAVNEAA